MVFSIRVFALWRNESVFSEVVRFAGYNFAPEVFMASDFAVAFAATVAVLSDSSVTDCS